MIPNPLAARSCRAGLVLSALAFLPFAASPDAQGRRGAPIPGLAAHAIQELDVPTEAGAFLLPVRLDGAQHVLDLRPRSIRADGFRVLVPRDGRLVPYPAPAPRTLEGSVVGFEGSRVVGALVSGGISLHVDLGDGRSYEVQPEPELVPGAPASRRHVTFRTDDVYSDGAYSCGTDESMQIGITNIGKEWLGGGDAAVTGNEIFDLACDADFEFFQLNGSSIANTVSDIEDILNRVRLTYEPELQLTLEVTTIVVRDTIVNPYTSPDSQTLLNQFRLEWNTNTDLGGNVRRDVAHLFTGKEIVGNVIGIAYVGVMCDSLTSGFGYGLSQSRFTGNKTLRKCLTAHELGHNWDAGHCNGTGGCAIMCSVISGCPGGCSQFGGVATSEITAHKNSRGCLTTQQDPVAGGMLEEFPSGSLSVLNWSYNDGGAVNGNGSNEPTGPNALDLNAAGSGPYLDDDVRTNYIQLGALSEASVSYFVQHVGVEAGEELVVDYRINLNRNWVELDRVTSDGVDQTSFVYREVAVPANGLHHEFRLRFRTEVDESNDHWYVDNVAVGAFADVSVESSPSGESVTVTPDDNQANGDGTTPFARVYLDGASVTLTAPSSSGSLEFFDWELDSVPQGSDESLELAVAGDTTARAVYKAVFALSVASSGAQGVPIGVSPADKNGQGGGATPLARSYFDGASVELTAPSFFEGRTFRGWLVDGVPQPGGTTVAVSMDQARSAVASYEALRFAPPSQRP